MIRGGFATWRYAWTAALIAGYATVASYTNSNPQAHGLRALAAIAPLRTVGLTFAWRSVHRLQASAAALLLSALVASLWHTIDAHFAIASLPQECGIYTLLGYTFARTLAPAARHCAATGQISYPGGCLAP